MNQTHDVDHLPNDADGLFYWALPPRRSSSSFDFQQNQTTELDLDRSDRRPARCNGLHRLIKFFRADDKRPTLFPSNQSYLRITSPFQHFQHDVRRVAALRQPKREFHQRSKSIVPSSSLLHFHLFVSSLHSSSCALVPSLFVSAKFRLEFVHVGRGDRSTRPNARSDFVPSNHRFLSLLFAVVVVSLSDLHSQLRIDLR